MNMLVIFILLGLVIIFGVSNIIIRLRSKEVGYFIQTEEKWILDLHIPMEELVKRKRITLRVVLKKRETEEGSK